MREKFVNIKRSSSIGRACLLCGRPAVVTADRVDIYETGKRFRLFVRYCEIHEQVRISGEVVISPSA